MVRDASSVMLGVSVCGISVARTMAATIGSVLLMCERRRSRAGSAVMVLDRTIRGRLIMSCRVILIRLCFQLIDRATRAAVMLAAGADCTRSAWSRDDDDPTG